VLNFELNDRFDKHNNVSDRREG